MNLTGQVAKKVDIASDGKLLYEIYKYKPNDVAGIAPDKVRGCDLVSGEWGAVGSVISWNYLYDGKIETAKEIVQEVDDKAHKIVFKVIEGQILKAYKEFTITFHIEGDGNKEYIIWTIDFEKVDASIPDPSGYLDVLGAVINEIDAHILKKA
ncbi:kirola-like [Rutidosis leptorrhynchoides]|uniref:kirola-like n=1 Tax=Rutidosis leptorrhynchoides TaxID=125765 RepID=UPI003A9A4CCE